ncbi:MULTISPECIES: pyridoxamine 5'-phosphate oxidase family protein [Mycobacteriaceae]|uniref:pyridoxamine 5'-phosphate oxidase family protein n=1 Tax=Mycobacteriaceae TaxID=1762 RepID=UPI0007FCEC3D|nr:MULTISPECIES: pyridoxamine 5'-phosphate oxidase family protein [Mycobacteriaceae]MCK0176063.1 pyridoxamine 5'-phosphate oxidase family protein [Mycolicibacterium sp. F2034L]OBB58292.1 pyridoxamine 5'-phosphate oxidase [Mycobacterium sp. 852013-51886_SCH5428379]
MNGAVTTSPLSRLTRKPDRAADLALLHAVFDECAVATVSTVLGDEPWAVPMLVARDGDRLLLHGSTGAGALRHIADGAKVCVSAFVLDGLVIAERQFDHSANYRSAVVRGVATVVPREESPALLDRFTEGLIPGRVEECPPHSAREVAATLLLAVRIVDGQWLAKARSGPAAEGAAWTGVVPVETRYSAPVSDSALPVPPSVRRLISG